MTAKEYLSKLEKIEVEIEQKTEERQELMQRATSITTTFGIDKVQTSPKHDRMAELVAKAADMEREIALMLASLWDERNKIVNRIHALNTTNYITLLYKRYVQNKSLGQIAEEMSYSDQYVREMHCKAIKEFERVHADVLQSDYQGKE